MSKALNSFLVTWRLIIIFIFILFAIWFVKVFIPFSIYVQESNKQITETLNDEWIKERLKNIEIYFKEQDNDN